MKDRTRDRRADSRLLLSTVLITALSLGVAACGGGDATGSPTSPGREVDDLGLGAKVLDAARQEGEVGYIGSTLQAAGDQIQATLRDEYGIELTVTSLKAAETLERLRTEQRAGNRTIDVVGLGVQYGAVMKKEGLSIPFKPEGYPDFLVDAAEYDAGGYWYPFQLNLYGVAVNKGMLDPSTVSSWDALADGSIVKPIIIADPSIGSAGLTWAVAMQEEEKYGPAYLERLGRQGNLQLGPVHPDNLARVARGDVAAYFPVGTFDIPSLPAQDVTLVFPGDEPYVGPINLSLTKGAPHPNAAKVLMSFLMSERGQVLLAEGGATPTRRGVKVPDAQFDVSSYQEVIDTHLDAVLRTQDDIEGFSQRYFRGGN